MQAAFLLCNAIDNRWYKNVVWRASPVAPEMRLPEQLKNSSASAFQTPVTKIEDWSA